MSRREDRFEKRIQLASRRSPEYLRTCRGALTGDVDPRTVAAYGQGPIDKNSCVRAYTEETNLYKEVNAALAYDTEDVAVHAEFIYHAKQQMKSLYAHCCHRFEGEVYRYVDLTAAEVAEFYPGREFLWAPFVSTSKRPDSIFSSRPCVFQIDCDGPGLTYAVDICSLSAFPSEQEVLLYPYSGYKVIDVVQDHWINCSKKTLIRLQVKDTLLVEG